ncbi:MAG: M28 family peptidase [Ignavibacteria bacterium]|nr:M28 family peptidase [Ignavibacteria bacterium]
MAKSKTVWCLLIIAFQFSFAQVDPQIMELVAQVNSDSLYENLKILTGEKPITLFAGPIFISSRHKDDVGNSYAAEFIYRKFRQYGYETYRQDFQFPGQNIYAYKPGSKLPNQQLIICAHYDNMPQGNKAPGADDNGSGTAAVLEIARLLKNVTTDYTIIFALWDNEEQGLLGSAYYAFQANSRKDVIIGVINLDMIGYDSNNDMKMEIHTRDVKESNQMASKISKLNSFYGIGLSTSIVNPGSASSDHASFWNFNYSAVLLIESFADFNAYYHKQTDTIDKMNKTFYTKNTQLALASLCDYAQITISSQELEIPTLFQLFQNYPNPFNPTTKIRFQINERVHVKLVVFDLLGNEIAVLKDEVMHPNQYELHFNAERNNQHLSSGVYFYALYAGKNFSVKKMILAK